MFKTFSNKSTYCLRKLGGGGGGGASAVPLFVKGEWADCEANVAKRQGKRWWNTDVFALLFSVFPACLKYFILKTTVFARF